MARYKIPVYDRHGNFVANQYFADFSEDWDGAKKLNEITRTTPGGRQYITQHDYLEAVNEAAIGAEERYDREDAARTQEPQPTSDAELHMHWALMQDPNLTVEDYLENLAHCPGYGPRPAKGLVNRPGRPVRII